MKFIFIFLYCINKYKMPRVPTGELSLGEIRNLVRQHNKLSVIKGVDTKSRSALLKEIAEMGYRVDHAGKKIVRGKMEIKTGAEGEQKPQKRTIKKQAKAALTKTGSAPVLVSKADKEKAKEKARKLDQLKRGYPTIPKNVKGKKVKPDRSALIAGKGNERAVLKGAPQGDVMTAKRGRGRPKGSKNKPKAAAYG